jgi:hypothetical protein
MRVTIVPLQICPIYKYTTHNATTFLIRSFQFRLKVFTFSLSLNPIDIRRPSEPVLSACLRSDILGLSLKTLRQFLIAPPADERREAFLLLNAIRPITLCSRFHILFGFLQDQIAGHTFFGEMCFLLIVLRMRSRGIPFLD